MSGAEVGQALRVWLGGGVGMEFLGRASYLGWVKKGGGFYILGDGGWWCGWGGQWVG